MVASIALVLRVFCCIPHAHTQSEDEYMISDYDLFVNKYISVPRDMGQLTCAAFVAGIVKGVLEGAGFPAGYGFCSGRRQECCQAMLPSNANVDG